MAASRIAGLCYDGRRYLYQASLSMPDESPIQDVAEDVYQIKLPLPFALKIVNCYLIRGDEGWTIVDTGINIPEAREVWLATFETLDIQLSDIQQIIITHMHPDHFGLAGWLHGLYEPDARPPLYLPAREERQTRLFFDEQSFNPFYHLLLHCGMPDDMAWTVAKGLDDTRAMTKPFPESYQHLTRKSDYSNR